MLDRQGRREELLHLVDALDLRQHLPFTSVGDHRPQVADERDPVVALVRSEIDSCRVLPEHGVLLELEGRLHRVRRLGRVVRVAELSAVGHHAPRAIVAHGVMHHIDQVDSPVGHQPARVVPEPAEVEVEAVRVERAGRRRPEPHIVIDPVGDRLIRLHGNGLHPSLIGPGFDESQPTDRPRSDMLRRLGPMPSAPLPLADLYHGAEPLRRCYHQPTLADGVGEGLLHVHVFSGFARHDHHEAVPMVRRSDDDGVDVRILQKPSEVGVERGARLGLLLDLVGTLAQDGSVDVAEGSALDLRHLQDGEQVREAHSVAPDHAYADLIAGCHPRLPSPEDARQDERSACEDAGIPEETTSRSHGSLLVSVRTASASGRPRQGDAVPLHALRPLLAAEPQTPSRGDQ